MPETKAIAVIDEVVLTIAKQEDQYRKALPSHIPSDRFVRVAQTAIRRSPELVSCSKSSIYSSLLKCAADGLIPDGREAAIIPFGTEAVYMPMVYGICKKARNSGELAMIDAIVIYEKDEFDSFTDENGPHFKHRKFIGDRGKPILTLAYAKTKDGSLFVEEIDEAQMAAIEAVSKQKSGPWKGPFRDEMKRKSAIRRLAKYRLPSSADLDEVIKADDDLYDTTAVDDADKKEEPKKTSSRLNNVIDTHAEKTEPAPAPAPEPEPDVDDDLPI